MTPVCYFQIAYIFFRNAFFFQDVNEVQCVVNSVNNAIVIAVLFLVQCAALEPKPLALIRCHRFLDDVVHDTICIWIFGSYFMGTPPKRTGKNTRYSKYFGVLPGNIER